MAGDARITAATAAPSICRCCSRVTPEAIREMEGEDVRTICVLSQGHAKTMTWNSRLFQWCSGCLRFDNPLEWARGSSTFQRFRRRRYES
jgi:hypothetical protein